ncbi:MAG: alpha-L-fucosidase [Leadbetterella sp.]|nr:alpha-L-fucosidase [Leadbetterella sp.]
MKLQNLFVLCLILWIPGFAQNTLHPTSAEYQYPTDPKVAANLENWRDQKFGMIIHWGIYAVPGIIESWSICNEEWIDRDSTIRYDDYKRWYWNQAEKFNPVRFNPEQWAKAAKDAGMKYLVFTTKHHDGFNMFDTKYSDYKISAGPFKNNPRADVARYVFDAFRKEGMLIGAYYSKPDWHSQYFWWDKYATPDRNVNYDIRKHPWRWNKFKEYTHNQINELTSAYGKVDILWLDGGWVRPRSTVNAEVLSWGAPIPEFDQEIDMPQVAEIARKNQEGMLIVDRTVHGEFENYRTPEQGIPSGKSDDPWESCITLGGAWSYVPNDRFKSSEWAIHTLVEIVAKGGNLLLGVGPTAEGEFLPVQIERLQEIGKWLEKNGEAIYATRTVDTFKSGDFYFTRAKDNRRYAIRLRKTALTETVSWEGNAPRKGSKMVILEDNTPVKWKTEGNVTTVTLPKKSLAKLAQEPAITFKFEE